ncbi:MAG: hypothetical protein ACRD8Z_27735 [Nitrososphaeraceae archaeon]
MAAVTKAKQVNNNNKKNKVKAVEIVSKKSYERLLRNHDRLTQRVEDLEDVVKHMLSICVTKIHVLKDSYSII